MNFARVLGHPFSSDANTQFPGPKYGVTARPRNLLPPFSPVVRKEFH
jgi:hypothetical protein